MRVRFKAHPEETRSTSRFNIHALDEVDVGDDSVSIRDLDVEIDGTWVDMREAFRLKLIVPNNHNTQFGLPVDETARTRGYNW